MPLWFGGGEGSLLGTMQRAAVSVRGGGMRAPYLVGGGGVLLAAAGCLWLSRALSGRRKKGRVEKFVDYSQEERDWWRARKEAEKLLQKRRLERAMLPGEPDLEIAIDLSFPPAEQNDSGCRSLSQQLAYSYNYLRRIDVCCALHFTTYGGDAQTALARRGAESWRVFRHVGDLEDVFAGRMGDLVFLTPDAEEALGALEKGKVYVVGGLVDKTVKKHTSKRRADSLNIRTARLPVNEFVPRDKQGRGRILNINTVVGVLLRFKASGSWEEAFRETLEEEKGSGKIGEAKAFKRGEAPPDPPVA